MIPSLLLKEALVDHHTYYFGWNLWNLWASPTAIVIACSKKEHEFLTNGVKPGELGLGIGASRAKKC